MDKMEQAELEAEKDKKENLPPKALMKLLTQKEKLEAGKKIMEETETEEISLTDPDARMMGSPGKGFDIAHNMQMAVDSKHHIVLDCDVINNPTDRGEMTLMVERLIADGHIEPNGETAYLADKGYYSGEDLAELEKLNINTIVPRQNPPHPKDQPKMFWCNNFTYNKETDTYTCPAGNTLYPTPTKNKETQRHSYRNIDACKNCPHNQICISGKTQQYRIIKRSEHADVCDRADERYEQNKPLYNLRRSLAEHPFGTIKRHMNGGYFLLRTLPKVRAEAALFYLSYNLKRASNVLGFKEIMARLDARLTHFFNFSLNMSRFNLNSQNYLISLAG